MNKPTTAAVGAALLASLLAVAQRASAIPVIINQTAPPPGSVVVDTGRQAKVVLTAFVEIPDANNIVMGGPWVRFTVTCAEGPGAIVREPSLKTIPIVREELTIGELLALAPGKPAGQPLHVRWKVDAGGQHEKDGNRNFFMSSSSAFTIAAAANLALSLDGDFGSPWPKKLIVANAGGSKSQPSSLEVNFKLRGASDPAVKNRCPALDYHKVHTILALPPNDKSDFDLPKPQGGFPAAKPSGGAHRVVTCNYGLDAALAGDTNAQDPTLRNNRLQKTISIDIPLEPK